MRLALLICFLKICLVASSSNSQNWLNHATYCLQQESTNDGVIVITNNVTKNDSKLIDSAAEVIMRTDTMATFDITWVSKADHEKKKVIFSEILKTNSIVVYFSRADSSNARLRDFTNPTLTKILSIDLDSEFSSDDRQLQTSTRLRCFQNPELNPKDRIIANLSPTSYIDFLNNQLKGPEGKILQALIKSVNAKVSITKSGSSSSIKSIESGGVDMQLNLMPYKKSDKYYWSMVYHPYRKLGLIPATGHSLMPGHHLLEFCLLASVTVMIILLLYIMRRLVSIREVESLILSAIERLLFFTLIVIFFVNLGVLLSALFREKYGVDRPVNSLSYQLSELPQNECLQEMIKKKNVFCIVDEDFGREAVRRYGKDGNDKVIKLVTDMSFQTEWRGVYLNSPAYVEKFNRMQLRFIESGMLEKWYGDEMLSITAEEDEEIKSYLGFTKIFKQRERTRKFAFYLYIMIADGSLMAFLMFVGEWLMYGVKSSEKRMRYIYFD